MQMSDYNVCAKYDESRTLLEVCLSVAHLQSHACASENCCWINREHL